MSEEAQKKIAEIEARRAQRREATAKARLEQHAKDLEKVDQLEVEHGEDHLAVLEMPSFSAGLPTLVVVKTPTVAHFNRFRQMVRKASKSPEGQGAAQDMLASCCVAYPDEETYERMKDTWPSVHDNVGLEAIRLGEAVGKG